MTELLKIFFSFFKIGLFTFGGGYTMIVMMQREISEKNKWLTHKEFLDYLSLAQASPGPMAVNTAILIGYKQRGIAGGIAGFLGSVLPSFIVLLLVAIFFSEIDNNAYVEKTFKGLRPAVVAMILYSVIVFAKNTKKWEYPIFTVIAGIIVWGVSPIYFILGGVLSGIVYILFKSKKGDNKK